MVTCLSPYFKTLTSSTPLKTLLFLLTTTLIFHYYLFLHHPEPHAPPLIRHASPLSTPLATTVRHLLFSVASYSNFVSSRKPYLRLWYSPNFTRALLFVERPLPADDPALPPVVVYGDTSSIPYTFRGGRRSAIRLARMVKEAVERNESDVRWFVFGDDDTVFFVDNLVRVLSKYDHDRWFYVGSNSEDHEQNAKNSFDMAFGGGGFAISRSLARVLARVLDSCLVRYAHLYGSDARVYSCLVELGVGLTHESGFHQVDVRGNLLGMLTAHPLSPLVSLHHLEHVESIFPNMNQTQALEHLFKAVNVDPARILQQTVCYDRSNSLTISVAWGYAVQVFEGNQLLPDLLSLQKTFRPWRRSMNIDSSKYMFNTREYPKDPCKRPAVFFLESVISHKKEVWSNYKRHIVGNCLKTNALKDLKQIRVFSRKLKLDIDEVLLNCLDMLDSKIRKFSVVSVLFLSPFQTKGPRRQCCDVVPAFNGSMAISIRHCGVDELISMHL